MSKLKLRGALGAEFELTVTQFRSLMTSTINSVQTRTMQQHFPVRADQPDVQFTVQFPDASSKHAFQSFVRRHQVASRDMPVPNMVYLWWPQRGITNWSGYITGLRVTERYDVVAPKVTFGVALVDSMMSRYTAVSSVASFWTSILGPQISGWDPMLRPPASPARNQQQVAEEFELRNRNQPSSPPGVGPALVAR